MGIPPIGTHPGRLPVTKDDKGKFVFNFLPPDTVTSREKLGNWLVEEQGIKRTTPEYREAYKTLGVNLPAVDPKK
jgi:hypothetical protein